MTNKNIFDNFHSSSVNLVDLCIEAAPLAAIAAIQNDMHCPIVVGTAELVSVIHISLQNLNAQGFVQFL